MSAKTKRVQPERRVDPALARELRAAFVAQQRAEKNVTEHNARGRVLEAEFVIANAKLGEVNALARRRYKLKEYDGVEIATGIIKVGMFAPKPTDKL